MCGQFGGEGLVERVGDLPAPHLTFAVKNGYIYVYMKGRNVAKGSKELKGHPLLLHFFLFYIPVPTVLLL